VRVWDTSTGEELANLRGHEDCVFSLAFSPDGTQLASASLDTTLRVWDSVPYGVRYRERRARLAARPEAERIVDELWDRLSDADSIAEQVRTDTSLGEQQRLAALNLLLRKSAELQNQVNELYTRLVFTDHVVTALEADASLTPGARFKAIGIARAKGDEPIRLNRESWHLVSRPHDNPKAYEIGLRGAEAAAAAEPDNVAFVNTLGVAQYRNGRYEEAYITLTRSDELRRQQGKKSVPHDVAFLAMAMLRLGRVQEAQTTLERLYSIIGDPEEEWRENEESIAMLEECKQLLEGPGVTTDPLEDVKQDDE
jgi:tetratricopeptide (TPR) repeat protein